ncbi:unnamed protein product [Penicillium bialowiezense]
MFRPAARALARAPNVASRTPANTRLISTGPSKPRGWKNTILRLGLAGGAVYYYNTSSVFSEEPKFSLLSSIRKQNGEDANTQTLDSITPKIRQERAAAKAQELQDEAGQEAAFNPETGEINWDCPCLGGMAHGPCGEDFKGAFSCFVYSEEEPKGIDCIEKFKAMQDCFRQYPEVYGAELEDDDEPQADAPAPAPAALPPTASEIDAASHPEEKHTRAKDVNTQMKADTAQVGENPDGDSLIPKAAHDTEEKNQTTKA